MSNGFGPENPENGNCWRTLASDEVAIFEDATRAYGRADLSELNGMPTMKGKQCARFFWLKGSACAWAKAMAKGSKVLAVPALALQHGVDFDVWRGTTDVYIIGGAARAHGITYEPDDVP